MKGLEKNTYFLTLIILDAKDLVCSYLIATVNCVVPDNFFFHVQDY